MSTLSPSALMRQHGNAVVANTATLCGDVRLGLGVSIWFSAVVRGDVAPITIGDRVNIQDGAVVHCDFDVPQTIEEGVVVGHAAVLHGVRVGRDTLIGIGARLLGGSIIGEECMIAAGTVVAPGKVIPPRSVVMGIPGKIVRTVTDEEVELTRDNTRRYFALAQRYLQGGIA